MEKGNVSASDTGAFDMLNINDDLVHQTNLWLRLAGKANWRLQAGFLVGSIARELQ